MNKSGVGFGERGKLPNTSSNRLLSAIVAAIVALTVTLLVVFSGASGAAGEGPAAITVEGETPAQTNIPFAADANASGGAYLALDTKQAPAANGWYATYQVNAPAAGVYSLDAIVSLPAGPERYSFGGSYFNLAVNGGAFEQVAKAIPYWAESQPAWGELYAVNVDEVELAAGANTISFMVNERRILPAPAVYKFLLDKFTLTPTPVGLADAYVGDPNSNIGVYRVGETAQLHFRLNGHTPTAQTVEYSITNYSQQVVASGSVAIPAGEIEASVPLPDLPPGHYTSSARLSSAPERTITGSFARVPAERPVGGPDSPFAVMTAAPELVPSSKLHAFAAGMKEMGAGYVRDEIFWPMAEEARGVFDTARNEQIADTFHQQGLGTLEFWGSTTGAQSPSWATSKSSEPLPADLRDAYDFAHELADPAKPFDALEVWNEPETKNDHDTGDQIAAYTKAAALGIADSPHHPLVSLPANVIPARVVFPGRGELGSFQDLVLQNEVVSYADIWSFHGYPAYKPGALTAFPPQAKANMYLRRLYGAKTQMWMTEAGMFIPSSGEVDLTASQQADQARYLVQSTVQSLAAGTDKHFWFIGSPYWEGGPYLGMLDRNFQPFASYSAHAAMTSLLGRAEFVGEVAGLPAGVRGFTFSDRGKTITVVWSATPTQVSVPLPGAGQGTKVTTYDIMGAPQGVLDAQNGAVDVAASLDPVYLVTKGVRGLKGRQPASRGPGSSSQLSEAQHIVLSQQFAEQNLAPVKSFRNPPPFGYQLGSTTQMSLDVYNFNDRAETVSLVPRAWGGWSVSPSVSPVVVPAKGKVSVPFTVTAGAGIRPGVDYPLVFEATLGGKPVPASVSRIQLATGSAGEPIRLVPSIADISPVDGATVQSRFELTARLSDELSGIAPSGIRVEVDGAPVYSRFDSATGILAAPLRLTPGPHSIWIRAANNAHAPAATTIAVVVAGSGSGGS